MEENDYYGVLGVGKDSSADEISQAYRQLARQVHPDVNPQDPTAAERFKAISEAYAVLSDPVRRSHYDASLAARQGMEQPYLGVPPTAPYPRSPNPSSPGWWAPRPPPSWPRQPPPRGVGVDAKIEVERAANEAAEAARQALSELREALQRLTRDLANG